MHTYHYGDGQHGNQDLMHSLIINLLGLGVLG